MALSAQIKYIVPLIRMLQFKKIVINEKVDHVGNTQDESITINHSSIWPL